MWKLVVGKTSVKDSMMGRTLMIDSVMGRTVVKDPEVEITSRKNNIPSKEKVKKLLEGYSKM